MVGGVGMVVVGFIVWVILVFRGFLFFWMYLIFEWFFWVVELFFVGL